MGVWRGRLIFRFGFEGFLGERRGLGSSLGFVWRLRIFKVRLFMEGWMLERF